MSEGGYKFEDDGHGGAWTVHERALEQQRRGAQQTTARAEAEANMQAAIDQITDNPSLTTQQKRRALRLLQPSGYSEAEWALIDAAIAGL